MFPQQTENRFNRFSQGSRRRSPMLLLGNELGGELGASLKGLTTVELSRSATAWVVEEGRAFLGTITRSIWEAPSLNIVVASLTELVFSSFSCVGTKPSDLDCSCKPGIFYHIRNFVLKLDVNVKHLWYEASCFFLGPFLLPQNLRPFCVLLRLLRFHIIPNPFLEVLFPGTFFFWHIPHLFFFLLHLLLPCQPLIFLILLFFWRPVCFWDPLSFFLFAVPFTPFSSSGPNKIARLKKVFWNTLTHIHSRFDLSLDLPVEELWERQERKEEHKSSHHA